MRLVPAFLAALLIGCNQPPSTPVVAIGPAGATTTDDLNALIYETAEDPNGDSVNYVYTWFQGGLLRTDLSTDTVSADETTKGERWTVMLSANDGEYTTDQSSAALTVENSLPQVTSVTLSPEAPLSTDDLVLTVEGADSDEDPISFSYAWSVDGVETLYVDPTLPSHATSQGEVWSASVRADDGEDEGEPALIEVIIDNTAPLVTEVSLTPDPAYEDSSLLASVEATDIDGQALAFTYRWVVDGSDVVGEDSTLDGDSFDKGQVVSVWVIASDGVAQSDEVPSDEITISNSLPTLTGVRLSPAFITTTDDVTCIAEGFSDADGDEESILYSLTVNGAEISVSDTLSSENFQKNDDLECIATPSDGEEAGTSFASTIYTVENTPPEFTVSPEIYPNSPTAADELYVEFEAWDADGGGGGYDTSYEWYVNGILSVSSNDSLTSDFGRGDAVYCEVTVSDEDDSVSETTNTVTIVNARPVITDLAFSSGEVFTDDVLTAEISTYDADADTVDIDYAWYIEGSLVSTDESLDGSQAGSFEKGNVVMLYATPDDGTETGDTWEDLVNISNSPPTAPEISIDPEEPVEGIDDLVCLIDVDSTDADGDTFSYTFTWMAADGTSPTVTTTYETGDTVPASETFDEEWQCEVYAKDSQTDGDTVEATVDVSSAELCASMGLNGSSDWVDVPDLSLSNSSWTFEAWMDFDWTNSSGFFYASNCHMLSFNPSGNLYAQTFPNCNGTSTKYITGLDGADFTHLPSGWQHFAAVSDGATTTTFYINGIPFGTASASYDSAVSNVYNGGLAARTKNGTTEGFLEVGYYAVRISDTERYEGAFTPEEDLQTDGDTVLLYTFEDSSTSITDQSGNGFGGSLTGGTWSEVCPYDDDDGDGYEGWTDCNDNDASIYPMAGDTYGDGSDGDCDQLDCEASSDGNTYFAACGDYYNWEDAELACQEVGYVSLASILIEEEQDHIAALLDNAGLYMAWMGLNDLTVEGDYEWTDGNSFDFTAWQTGEPNDTDGSENCGVLGQDFLYREWNDGVCSLETIEAFVCQGEHQAPG